MQAFEMGIYYTRDLQFIWKITNETVLPIMIVHPHLISTITIRKTRYLGHLKRHKVDELLQVMLQVKKKTKRGMGRKRNTDLVTSKNEQQRTALL